ncbi:hypothetical protein ADK64_10940 [Streptomyces sp. MMG1121]|nr:hypothetical protein ADK64_10940 [Streptomyces sp. MMG1121]
MRALSAGSAQSTRAAGEKYAVPLPFDSAEGPARSTEVELVVMTVKVPHHPQLVRPALGAGKTVFSEWPLGVFRAAPARNRSDGDRRAEP